MVEGEYFWRRREEALSAREGPRRGQPVDELHLDRSWLIGL